MPDYRSRTVDAPGSEWLTVEQAAAYLQLEVSEFLERVALGVFPPGSPSSLRKDQWSWQAVQGISWLRPWLDQLFVEAKRAKLAKRRGKSAEDAEASG